MNKIKIAQIGTGHDHASQNFSALLKQTDMFEVVGYARVEDEDDSTFADLKQYEITLDRLLATPDLEAIIVETCDWRLVQYAQFAADKGYHVFMDKPGSQSAEDFEKMLSTLRARGKVFSIGYMYRFNEGVKEVIAEVRKGTLGEVYSVEAQMSCQLTPEKRQWLGHFEGGMTFYLGCHLVDLIYALQGLPEQIIPFNACTGTDGVTAKDLGMVVFKYKNGTSFLKTCANEPGGYERRNLVVCGNRGTAVVQPLEWRYGTERNQQAGFRYFYLQEEINADNVYSLWHRKAPTKITAPQQRYDGMLRDFGHKIRNGTMTDADYVREARVHRLVLAASGIECDYKADIIL